jgi:hypothetical protein
VSLIVNARVHGKLRKKKTAMQPISYRTGECDAGAGDDTRLHHGVLLPRERLGEDAAPLQAAGPRLHQEEGQQPRRHVQRRHDPRRQVQLHHDEAQEQPQRRAHHHRTHRDLLRPRRQGLPLERLLRRQRLARRRRLH